MYSPQHNGLPPGWLRHLLTHPHVAEGLLLVLALAVIFRLSVSSGAA